MSDAPAAALAKRVFISHSSKDKPAVEKLARALRAAGIDAWLDKWEISPGDDIVARINEGLEACAAGLVVCSSHSKESPWVKAEVSSLTHARIQEGKPLIPVCVDDAAYIPPLLRPLARLGIADVEAIIEAIHERRAPPPLGRCADKVVHRACFAFDRVGATGLRLTVTLDGRELATASRDALPAALVAARNTFLQGFRHVPSRSPEQGERHAFESNMRELGRALGELCLPGESGQALAALVDGCGIGPTVELAFEANHPELLGLPFEALCLPDGRLLATLPAVTVLRRPRGVAGVVQPRLAGPLKILVAVGAPDEGHTSSALDVERELQGILDAIEDRAREGNAEVRILEVGHPDVIRKALERDAYHVLHLSCHGKPGELELEDEEGRAVAVPAEELIQPLAQANRALPLVFLSACHGGVGSEQTASLAEALLKARVPAVVAMQAAVSDAYATSLARAFYANLSQRETPLASQALAQARRELEEARRKAVADNKAPLETTLPEYATAALYVAGEEQPLADYGLDKVELKERPVYRVAGPVPQLGLDELIGRRKVLRETLRTLRGERKEDKHYAGVVLTGIGGVGKSAVAGRAMCRLAEQGYLVPAHVGRWNLQDIAMAVGMALLEAPGDDEKRQKRGKLLASPQVDDGMRFQLLAATLAEERVVLVLDDFEQNLPKGGGAFLDADVEKYLGLLLHSARAGKLLLTSRYPVPGSESHLRHLPVGPLSNAESRKLFQRLSGLGKRPGKELREVLQAIGGHPRMLEFLDGLLRGGDARLPDVTKRLREARQAAGLESDGSMVELEEGIRQTVLLGMRDVFLEELLSVARREGLEETLLQVAVSNLPVSPAGVAHMLAGVPADAAHAARKLKRLESLSLVFRDDDGEAWVHRWTAEGLAKLVPEAEHRERHRRAGRYRMWRANESHDLGDGIEAVRNYLTARDFDEATEVALGCFDALRRFQRAASIAAVAREVLESLPVDHENFAPVADEEAEAHLALGFTDRALERYEHLRELHERRVAAEPGRADYQRDLAISYQKVGELYFTLGQSEKALEAFLQSLAIAECLAKSEPNRADYQHDVAASYNKAGNLYLILRQVEEARAALLKSLAIAERLVTAHPNRADYQRDLSVSYESVGDIYLTLEEYEKAHVAYLKGIAIAERLAKAESGRADYQRDLLVSYGKIGRFYLTLGQHEKAHAAFLQSLSIVERLAKAEPNRADYQMDLADSLVSVGGTMGADGIPRFQRALALLRELNAQGRLAPADQPKIVSLETMLRTLNNASAS